MNLQSAIRSANLAKVLELMRSGVDVEQRDPDGLTPLMIASGLGHAQMVGLLITARADVRAVDPRMGSTALHKAAQSGNRDVIGLLLDHGAFIDQQSPILGHTSLMDAVLHKHEGAVRLLLERGARTTIRNHWQQTALELARNDGLSAIVGLIEKRNEADLERVRTLSLAAAVMAGNAGEVERLVADGADLNARIPITGSLDDDYTPLGLAVRDGFPQIVRLLLDAGADPRRTIGLMKGTPVHEAAFFGRADIIRLFADLSPVAGRPAVELDAQGQYNGLTPLHDAVWHGHLEAAQALIDAGAPLHLRSHTGLTPRELAVLYGYDEIALVLADAEKA